MQKTLRYIGIAVSLAAVVAACSQPIPTSHTPTPKSPTEVRALPPVSDAARGGRGTLVDSTPFTDIDPTLTATGATATRITYQSTSGVDGSPVRLSGSVFRPAGPAPEGGWNVVSFGHGTPGSSPECGPSRHPDLLGYRDAIASFMKLGVVAVMTDYQGLGVADGQRRYLEPDSAGYNIIDAVRAARAVVPESSTKWAALGVTEGGQAVWSAAELADYYGTGLDFVGAVALSPVLDLTQIAELSVTNWLTRDQQLLMPFLIEGFQSAHPEVNPDDYLHGVLASDRPMWVSCTGPLVQKRAQSIGSINPGDTTPVSAEAADMFKSWLSDIALPRRTASGPMLVINGSEDTLIRPVWVRDAIATACEYGDTIQHIVRLGQTHYNLDAGGETATWVMQRFAGEPAPSDC
ncbi:lipase family protein [Rhodococcus sp. ARC_M6]|uniref:lipase family protein n=1 Tax=Rhodococcus sp. ARC_M6 TaxID=2928852 RepID=UPI001FB215D3|nr:lipase family protein [Rhodococcus sp. ARC_M6]MCJ0904098.1 lipase family protein [Rhodococcus sp. ARC_M6]